MLTAAAIFNLPHGSTVLGHRTRATTSRNSAPRPRNKGTVASRIHEFNTRPDDSAIIAHNGANVAASARGTKPAQNEGVHGLRPERLLRRHGMDAGQLLFLAQLYGRWYLRAHPFPLT